MKAPSQGFTLIELLMAVAIVAILATIAVASYQDHTRRSARAEAKAVLMEAAGWLERSYTTTGNYNATLPAGYSKSPKEGTARYTISLTVTNVGQGYTLQAAPTGSFSDPECGNLTLTHTGVKGVSGDANGNGTAGDAEDVQQCWNR